jgi:hypothetical protein
MTTTDRQLKFSDFTIHEVQMYTEEQLHCRSGFNLVEIRLPKKFDVCIKTENF